MSQSHWTIRAFSALVGRETLPVDLSIKACAGIGAWLGVAALGSLLLAGPEAQGEGTSGYVALGVAIVVLSGAALSWYRSNIDRAYLFIMGVALVGMVAWYPFYMSRALSAPRAVNARFSHMPGILALALAFGVRLAIDAWQGRDDGSLVAQRVSIAALGIGGALDLFVLQQMVSRF
jgi:hypothetical protein